MIVLDFIVTIFQSIFLAYSFKYCLPEIGKKKIFLIVFATAICSCDMGRSLWGFSSDYLFSINNLVVMSIISIFCRKETKKSLTIYSIVGIIISLYVMLSSNVILALLRMFISERYINYELAAIVYIPQILLMIYLIKNIKIIQSIYKSIIYEKMEISTIIIYNVLFLIILLYRITIGYYSQLIKNIIFIMFTLGLIGLIFYFQNIHNTSKRILALNDALEIKNNELRKIKHDYGAQISYLYGLALMDRYDDVKKSLKKIINDNQNTADAVEVKISNQCIDNSDSLLKLALKPAVEKGIHVILEEQYDITLMQINDMDLYRIISNIINNAVKAMNGSGIITVKAYELVNKVIIEISNNGPKIPVENIDLIFAAGFTTKANNDRNHGYGLSIVKELVEKNNGKITVKSTEEKTMFKICFNMI